jgi:two-component system sensor histidine kinase KdpD
MVFGAILLSIRSNIDVSTAGLVLVIPVVVGAVVGGFFAGTVSVVTGFLVYDFWFVPPYGTLTVGTTQNWTALVVYAAVMLLVVRVVTGLDSARLAARRGDETMRRLSDLSEQLVGDQPVEDLLKIIVDTAHHVFGVSGVSLLVLHEERLFVAASAGEELTLQELHRLEPGSGLTVSVGTANISSSSLRTIALSASGRPIGILAMRGLPESSIERAVLTTFANDAALAIERAQLREQALRSQLLEQVDRLRRGLMGAVSHDLRTPLATIKVASSTLSNDAGTLSGAEMRELYFLIEIEADRLTRLVTNLLDMTRIESGVLRAKQCPAPVSELVDDALAVLGPSLGADAVKVSLCGSLPSVNVDRLLVVQVLINLLDNAARHAPPDSVIEVTADLRAGKVVVAVEDAGTGVAIGDREAVFDRFAQFDTGGRAGLGLTIARTFVEAHGERIWCEGSKYGGARFAFSLPAVLDDSSRS